MNKKERRSSSSGIAGISARGATLKKDGKFVGWKRESRDIKPGSDPNCFNNDGHGVIPVAILGSADFDVAQIDASTVQLDSLGIKAVGKANKFLAHIEDVNGDSFDDLVIQIEDVDGSFDVGDATATVTGELFEGSDSICIVGTTVITVP